MDFNSYTFVSYSNNKLVISFLKKLNGVLSIPISKIIHVKYALVFRERIEDDFLFPRGSNIGQGHKVIPYTP